MSCFNSHIFKYNPENAQNPSYI